MFARRFVHLTNPVNSVTIKTLYTTNKQLFNNNKSKCNTLFRKQQNKKFSTTTNTSNTSNTKKSEIPDVHIDTVRVETSPNNKTTLGVIFTGLTSVTFVSNIIYAILRAKGRGNDKKTNESTITMCQSDGTTTDHITIKQSDDPYDSIIRTFSFFFGFPVSLLSYVCISEGSNKILGFDLSFMD